MSTYLNRPTQQPYAAGLVSARCSARLTTQRPDPDRFNRNALRYVAYHLPGESTWFGARVEPTFSGYDRTARDYVWCAVGPRGDARNVPDTEAAGISSSEYERLVGVEIGVVSERTRIHGGLGVSGC